jgi:hypothetical protein
MGTKRKAEPTIVMVEVYRDGKSTREPRESLASAHGVHLVRDKRQGHMLVEEVLGLLVEGWISKRDALAFLHGARTGRTLRRYLAIGRGEKEGRGPNSDVTIRAVRRFLRMVQGKPRPAYTI